jgi:hypothetical protein
MQSLGGGYVMQKNLRARAKLITDVDRIWNGITVVVMLTMAFFAYWWLR